MMVSCSWDRQLQTSASMSREEINLLLNSSQCFPIFWGQLELKRSCSGSINSKFSIRKIEKKKKIQPTSRSLSCTFSCLSPSTIRLTAWMLVVRGEAPGILRATAASALQPSGYNWVKTVQAQDKMAQSEQGRGCMRWWGSYGLTRPRSYQPPPLQHRWEEGSHLLGSQPNSHSWEHSPNQGKAKRSADIPRCLLFLR